MFNIVSGKIQQGVLYLVYGMQSVTYNGTTYTTGQYFRGVIGVTTYTFSGSGTQSVYETFEAMGFAIEYVEDFSDLPVFADATKLSAFAIEYTQSSIDIAYNDVTILNGFTIELLDYPFYSFAITETRL